MVAHDMRSQRASRKRLIVSRLIAGRKTGLAVAGVIFFGFGAPTAGLLGLAGVPVLLALGAVSGLIGLATAYLRGGGQILASTLVNDMRNSEAPYRCDFSTSELLAEACEMTKPHYGDEYVSADKAEQWRLKNPKAFAHLVNKDGELCASFGVLALTPSFTDQFFKGRVTDLQLDASEILSFEESRKAANLYLSGVIVRDPSSHLGHKRTAAMLGAMIRYIEKLYGTRKKRVLYAIAVTKPSEQLMANLGFTLRCKSRDRKDGHDLYCFELTGPSFRELKKRVEGMGITPAVCDCALLERPL
jgi:hypothetical protein